ncbi:MAG: hypothetical protein R6U91_01410 [Bacillota bacterium]
MKFKKGKGGLGLLLLGIWLIATGLLALLQLSIPYSDIILALLAIAAGVLIILKH